MRMSTIKMITLSMMVFSFFAFQSKAQSIHIVGDGTNETNYPPNTQVFEYNWSSMLYTSDEMGGDKTITEIAFDQTTDYAGYWEYAVLENQKIYMKQVDEVAFGSLAYEDPDNAANGYTLVFDGTVQFNLGWSQIDLISNFEYDGTKSLIVHWENRRGTSAPIVNVKFNASTVETNVFKALGGDGSFPNAFGTYVMERPNLAVYFESDGPATPVNPTPANNSYKAILNTDLEFVIGENTASYDVYFGINNPPTTMLVGDVAVSAPGSFSVNPSVVLGELLDVHTQYYWQVVAKNGAATSQSEVWNITTEGMITEFPYFTSFEDQPINPLYAETIDWTWPISGPANWRMIDFDAHSETYSVACNVWGEYVNKFSLVSPRIDLAENSRIGFWWKHYNGDGTAIDVYFEITTDGGANWTVLNEFELGAPMEEYEQYYIDLNTYSGNNTYVRWRYETLTNYVADYFVIDDLSIESSPNGAVIQIEEPIVDFSEVSVGTVSYLPLEVKNVGSTDLEITGSTLSAPFSVNTPVTITAGNTALVNIFIDADAQGVFNENVEFTGNFTGVGTFQIKADVYHVEYNFFENGDVSNELPELWSKIRTRDPYDTFTDITVHSTTYDAFSAPNAFRMMKMNDTISPLMLFTRGVAGYGDNVLSFYAKKSYDDYEATLQIGLSNDPLHADAFQVVETFEMTTEYQFFEVEFPSSSELPYIVFSFIDGTYASVIWMDDIQWDAGGSYPPYCPIPLFPANNADQVDVMMGLDLNWTSGGGNPHGYKLSVGTDAQASNIIDNVDVGDVLTYNFPIAPVYGQEYFWKVIAYNDHGESSGCGVKSFTVMTDPVQTVPFEENFDALDAMGEREYPLGWSVENANNDNFPWDVISDVATPGLAHSTPNAMHMLFSLNTMDDYLFTPPVALNGGNEYLISFWYRTMGDQWVPNPVERLNVYMGTDNNSASIVEELYVNDFLNNQDWEFATVSFAAPSTDEYYFSFYGNSDPNQGILLVDDVAISMITGVQASSDNDIRVYPNPARGFVKIHSNSEILSIEIFDIQSRLVYYGNDSNENSTINLNGLNKGTYLLKIKTADEVSTQKLIVK